MKYVSMVDMQGQVIMFFDFFREVRSLNIFMKLFYF